MKIRTHMIPAIGGLELDFVIQPADMIDKSKSSLRTDERNFLPTSCKIHLEHAQTDIFLKGKSKGGVSCTCFRCADEFDHRIDLDLFLTCAPRKLSFRGKKQRVFDAAETEQDSDEGLVYFDDQELDLVKIIREQILLSLPMRYLCRTGCKGLCEACGTNLNFGSHQCMKAASS